MRFFHIFEIPEGNAPPPHKFQRGIFLPPFQIEVGGIRNNLHHLANMPGKSHYKMHGQSPLLVGERLMTYRYDQVLATQHEVAWRHGFRDCEGLALKGRLSGFCCYLFIYLLKYIYTG